MLNPRDLADRQVIAAVREYDDLCRRRYTIIKLGTPIQRGWRRFYVLSDRALSLPDQVTLEAILAVIGTEVVHYSPDFRRRRGRRRKVIEIEQPLRPIHQYEWEKEKYPVGWRSYFRHEVVREWNRYRGRWVFTQPSLYELKVERNWQWYYREVDPDVETRLSEISRWLELHQGWRRYGWLKGQRQSYWKHNSECKKRSVLQRISQHEIEQAYIKFPEVDPAASMRCRRISFRQIVINFRVTPDGSQARSDHTTRIRYFSEGKSPVILAAPMPIRG